jgi:hypothetical protein
MATTTTAATGHIIDPKLSGNTVTATGAAAAPPAFAGGVGATVVFPVGGASGDSQAASARAIITKTKRIMFFMV